MKSTNLELFLHEAVVASSLQVAVVEVDASARRRARLRAELFRPDPRRGVVEEPIGRPRDLFPALRTAADFERMARLVASAERNAGREPRPLPEIAAGLVVAEAAIVATARLTAEGAVLGRRLGFVLEVDGEPDELGELHDGFALPPRSSPTRTPSAEHLAWYAEELRAHEAHEAAVARAYLGDVATFRAMAAAWLSRTVST